MLNIKHVQSNWDSVGMLIQHAAENTAVSVPLTRMKKDNALHFFPLLKNDPTYCHGSGDVTQIHGLHSNKWGSNLTHRSCVPEHVSVMRTG